MISRVPLQVGVINSGLGLLRGGLETTAAHLAQGLAQRGHQVTVMGGSWPGRGLSPELAALPVRWLRVPCLPLNISLWGRLAARLHPGLPLKLQSLSFWYACRSLPRLRKTILACDVTLTFLEVETAKISTWRQAYNQPNVSYFPGGIDEAWFRQDRSTVRVAISDTIAGQYPGLPIEGIVPPGIDETWFEGSYPVRRQAQSLVFVGRLEANKGVRELLDIFTVLAEEKSDLRLHLIGSGPLQTWVETEVRRRQLQDRTRCLGELPPQQIRQALHEADLFLFPSHYESFGIAVLEALAVGVPVICSDLPALREVVGEAAHLLPFGNVAAWVGATRHLLADRAARERLSRSGRRRAGQFTWSRSTKKLEPYLYQALRRRTTDT